MSEMVERVAQAMRVAHGDLGDYSPDELADYRETARVAIAAMRGPTEAMRMVGLGAYKFNSYHPEAWEKLLTEAIDVIWGEMIDAALSEEVKA